MTAPVLVSMPPTAACHSKQVHEKNQHAEDDPQTVMVKEFKHDAPSSDLAMIGAASACQTGFRIHLRKVAIRMPARIDFFHARHGRKIEELALRAM